MDVIGIPPQQQTGVRCGRCPSSVSLIHTRAQRAQVLQLVSAILWLGNVTFYEDGQSQAIVNDRPTLQQAAKLLQVDAGMLNNAITTRFMSTGRGGRRGKTKRTVALGRGEPRHGF